MNIHSKIRALRNESGLTQAELSARSGVSLAFLQRIEYGRANPSYETLYALLEALGFHLEIVENAINWNEVAAIGVPLTSVNKTLSIPNKDHVVKIIMNVCRYLKQHPDERHTIAVQAWLLAVHGDFPDFFASSLSHSSIRDFMPQKILGQHLKLRRIALEAIARYL